MHSIGKIRRGFYNYRAYPIKHLKRGWVVRDFNEGDGRDVWVRPTLKAMCRTIDRFERDTAN